VPAVYDASRHYGRHRRGEVQFESVAQIIESLIFSCPLADNINLNTLGNIPFAFLPDAGGERLFHDVRFLSYYWLPILT
jgi:hypothetical protein